MGEESKWICEGFRKRNIFPTLPWASELSTELLACVKRYTDVIEIDTAMPREKREQLSILHHHTPTLYAHAHTYTYTQPTEKFTVQTHCQEPRRKIQNNLFFYF